MNEEEIKNQIKSCLEGKYRRKLSEAELAEIIINLSGFFNLLNQFRSQDLEEKKKLENNGLQ